MKVGILVPVRNGISTIETCLTSIRDQVNVGLDTYATYVVDDASEDDTWQYLVDRPGFYTGLIHWTERRGWPAALNRAAAMAIADECDVLFIMNADDFLRLDCISSCVARLHYHQADFVIPSVQQVGGQNVIQASLPWATLGDFRDHTPLVAFCLIRASVWTDVGGYHTDVNLPRRGKSNPMAGHNEMDFYIRLLKEGYRYHVAPTDPATVYYRMHDGQLHREVVARRREALHLIHTKHPEVLTTAPSPREGESE